MVVPGASWALRSFLDYLAKYKTRILSISIFGLESEAHQVTTHIFRNKVSILVFIMRNIMTSNIHSVYIEIAKVDPCIFPISREVLVVLSPSDKSAVIRKDVKSLVWVTWVLDIITCSVWIDSVT